MLPFAQYGLQWHVLPESIYNMLMNKGKDYSVAT